MNEEEKENMDNLKGEVLERYFASRSPYPGTSELGVPLTEENKTTVAIADELECIIPISVADIACYMHENGYLLKTIADGSLQWQIWRDMNYL